MNIVVRVVSTNEQECSAVTVDTSHDDDVTCILQPIKGVRSQCLKFFLLFSDTTKENLTSQVSESSMTIWNRWKTLVSVKFVCKSELACTKGENLLKRQV